MHAAIPFAQPLDHAVGGFIYRWPCQCAGGSPLPPTVNAGPCALPLFAKPMDPTAKKSKPLNAGAPDLLLSIGVEQP